jgi:tight adherence protein B
MDARYLLFIIAIFIAVVLLLEGAYLWWRTTSGSEARRLARRLEAAASGASGGGERVSILNERMLSESASMQRLLEQAPGVEGLDRLLAQSGLALTTGQFLFRVAAGFGAGVLFALLMRGGLLWMAAAGAASGALPFLHVLRARAKRQARIEEQLPDAMDLIGRALRAGHAFPQALRMVGDEMTDPIGAEFRLLFDQVNYGASMQDALHRLAQRVPGTDLKYFVIAILIQRETGGNLAELLDNISSIIRSRLKLMGAIRVLSAEGRMSAWILSLLPFATALMIQLVNPRFMQVLWTDPLGYPLIGAALAMMGTGVLIMRRIIRIRV